MRKTLYLQFLLPTFPTTTFPTTTFPTTRVRSSYHASVDWAGGAVSGLPTEQKNSAKYPKLDVFCKNKFKKNVL